MCAQDSVSSLSTCEHPCRENRVIFSHLPTSSHTYLSMFSPLPQFNAFMSLIRDMLSKMETEHRTKLEQLDQLRQEQRSGLCGSSRANVIQCPVGFILLLC